MDLNICLFCEKPLDNDKLTFCSGTCQLNEATKNNNINYNYHPHNHQNNHHYHNNNMMIRSHSVQSISSMPSSSSPSNYEMSYHRRQSFSYSPVIRRRFSNSISSSSYDSLSSSALSFDSKYFLDQS
ncbi:unnamed protein product [Cunninghamella echinulata]